MIELIEIVKKIIEKEGKQSLIDSYELDEGLYVKVGEKPITKDDLFFVKKDMDKGAVIREYMWFSRRCFFEGMMHSDTNKALVQKGKYIKKIHSVTPYGIIFKFEKMADVMKLEALKDYFQEINGFHQGVIDIEKSSRFFLDRISEINQIIEVNEINMKGKRITLLLEKEQDKYEEAYLKYLIEKGDNKKYPSIEIDGEKYGVPNLGTSLDSKKIILTSSDIRKVPYRVSFADSVVLNYISKLRKNINTIISKYEGEDYEISFSVSEIIAINKISSKESKKTFRKFSPISKNTPCSVDSQKSHKEILEIIEKCLTNWTISPATTRYSNPGSDISDYFKNYSKKIDNQYILQQIIIDRDCFKHYFDGNDDIDISRSLERILMAVYEYECNKKRKGEEDRIPFGLLMFKLDAMISVMDYVSGKEKYKNMAIELNELLNKFIREKQVGEVSIKNDAEFYFLGGQLIRFLASQSEKKNKKCDLMGNFMLRSRDKIKDHIVDMYELYSHKISLFSQNYVNLVYQQIMAYAIGEPEKKNRDNWYYYQAGLAGKNVLFLKEEIEEAEKEEIEELEELKKELNN